MRTRMVFHSILHALMDIKNAREPLSGATSRMIHNDTWSETTTLTAHKKL